MDLPRVLAKIMSDWDRPADSHNRMSAWTFTQALRTRMKLHDDNNHDGSVDLLVSGCEVSLWVGEQFAADLHRVFPKLNIVTLSANKLLGQLGQSFPIPQTNFAFHAGSHNLHNSLCLLISHSGGTFATLACSNLLKSFTKYIFTVTSEWDTQVARSIRTGLGDQKLGKTLQECVRSYVFVTHKWRRRGCLHSRVRRTRRITPTPACLRRMTPTSSRDAMTAQASSKMSGGSTPSSWSFEFCACRAERRHKLG